MVSKKLHKSKRTKRFYGMTQLKAGTKSAWISVQNKNGWSLGFALGTHTIWLRNLRFTTRKDVENAFKGKGAVVFVGLKESK